MVEVATVFQEAYQHVLGNNIGDVKKELIVFVAGVVLKERPYVLVSHEGLPRAIELVFATNTHREFIFNLAFTFFSRWGGDDSDIQALAVNLARGVSQVNVDKGNNAVPEQYSRRLPSLADIKDLIGVNKWLMIVLMLQLFITVGGTTQQN